MSNCIMCGIEIPDNQKICSMCYGDPYHGSDGYYLEYLNKQEEKYLWDKEREEHERQNKIEDQN